ncbi:MAG: hydroxylamine reductase [Kiritimatiellaeota bacterium]|nr:hydroxylamine reductase [Kiritimatiellota bacterium]
MSNFFCFQCEQTAVGKACTLRGVCGKDPQTATLQDEITAGLVTLARARQGKPGGRDDCALVLEALFATLTNVNFDPAALEALRARVAGAVAAAGGAPAYPAADFFTAGDADEASLRSTLLFGLRGMAAYAWHAHLLGRHDEEVCGFMFKGLFEAGQPHTVPEWVALLMELGKANLACMKMLDAAHTDTFGFPEPTRVSTGHAPGPFIVVSGHDLHDLKALLEQAEGTGVNVYTHGEMLPGHAYPGLKKHAALKGHFGHAWQLQQGEFDNLPGAVLFTSNCLMPPRPGYKGNLFTTSVAGWPGVPHIRAVDGKKDFSAVIARARELGGWRDAAEGASLLTGFGHASVLAAAPRVVEAVKSGALKRIWLVGGCDGAKPGRDAYTRLVEGLPKDALVLTLGCGKFRFNHLQDAMGEINGVPRLLDMGQCNDAYSALVVALELARVFDCGVNDLPLSIVLSWYEQKAVCILLTLLSLGVRNIALGPSLPAFLSPNVLAFLAGEFNITPFGA